MENKKVKIKDVVKLINGYPFKQTDRGSLGLNIIRIQNLNNPLALYNKTTKEVSERYIVKKGDILISWSASLGVYEWKNDDAYLNQHIFKVEFISDKISKDYFRYVIQLALEELTYKMRGVGLKHLTKGQLDEYDFQLPSLEKQTEIIRKLNIVESLIEKRKRTKAILEELTKSKFLEMFGDPILNTKKWETKTITQLVKKQKNSIKRGPFGGTIKKEDFIDNGYLIYEQYHALNNDYSMARYFIDEKKYNNLIDFKVDAGDIIISCSGVNFGKLSIIPNDFKPGIINQALLKITLDNQIILQDFFLELFVNENFRKKHLGFRGVGIPNFPPISNFKKFKFIVPPLNLQNDYKIFIKHIRLQEDKCRKSLEFLEELFQSLLYNSFNLKELNEDEIDKLINDELEVETIIQNHKVSYFESLSQYNSSKDILFKILERTEIKNKLEKETSKFNKGIVQIYSQNKIEIMTNREHKLNSK